MAIKVLINGIFRTINLPKHLFMAISFELMATKIVLQELMVIKTMQVINDH